MLFIRAAHCHLWLIVRLAPTKQIRRMLTFFVDTAEAVHDQSTGPRPSLHWRVYTDGAWANYPPARWPITLCWEQSPGGGTHPHTHAS